MPSEHLSEVFPQGHGTVVRGDVLRHHSVPGRYEVVDVMHDGRVVLLDPRGERQRVWPDYVAENFKPVETRS